MKKSILFLSAAALLLGAASCQKFQKGEGGLEYKIVKDGGAEKAVAGDFLFVDIQVLSDRKDSVVNSSYDMEIAQPINIQPDSLPGMYAGDFNSIFKYLGEGDSAVFRLNLDTMAAKTGQPKPEFADKYATVTVNVRKHLKKGNLTDSAMFAKVDSVFKVQLEDLKKAEEGKISKYVSSNKLEPKKTASGLQYVIKEEGKGEKPALGDTVVVNYTGKKVNGVIFDTSDKETATKNNILNPMSPYEPLRFSLGNQPVITGWTEGLALLTKGTKATFIIPSALAYGDRPAGQKIGPYTPLIFDIELVDVIKGKPVEEQPTLPQPSPVVEPAN